jgi:prepilin-type N-terminal cleavage/methylation domain-containing protein
MNSLFSKASKQEGFTLVELAIVIVIAGLLIGLFGNFIVNYSINIKQKKVQSDLELISETIDSFLRVNRRLPCPARFDLEAGDAGFAREVITGAGTISVCDDVTPITAGITYLPTEGIVIGSIPTRVINLPDDYQLDPWGVRYTYAVTATQATAGLYDTEGGSISIEDPAGNTLITPADRGSYVIVSHGRNRNGARTLSGAIAGACTGGDPEVSNCNGSPVFVNTIQNSDVDGQIFDDYVVYNAGAFLVPEIPEGAVMAFDSPDCPIGWSQFTAARGRTIVGVTPNTGIPVVAGAAANSGEISFPAGPTDGSATTAASVIYTVGDFGGSIERADRTDYLHGGGNLAFYENRDPYIALMYCRKN